MQKAVEVQDGDTPEILQRRVMEQAEWIILPQAVENFCAEMQNDETLSTIEEVRELKNNPNTKAYNSFAELLDEVRNEI